jgi:hypothetical protein
MTDTEPGAAPKNAENDPPAANRPVAESPGSPPPKPAEPVHASGRQANDPSRKQHGLVPEVVQAVPGKPDGEVATGRPARGAGGLFDEETST